MARKKLDINKKPVKYALAVRQGKSKTVAKRIAGYAEKTTSYKIEQTQDFKAVVAHFKDELLAQTTLTEIAEQLKDNIFQPNQDKKDRNASNRAIELALSKIEPEEKTTTEEKVMVIFSN